MQFFFFKYSTTHFEQNSQLKIVGWVPVADLIEGVEVPLSGLLRYDPGLLQEVIANVTSDGVALVVEMDVHVLSKS